MDTLVLVLNQIEQDIESLVNIQRWTCGEKKSQQPNQQQKNNTKPKQPTNHHHRNSQVLTDLFLMLDFIKLLK